MIKEYAAVRKKRKKFVEDYPIDRIRDLSLEEYCVGRANSFCYRLEFDLIELGDMRGANSSKFGAWYGRHGKNKTACYRCTQKFSPTLNVNEAFDNIKTEIFLLLNAAKTDDDHTINNNKLCDLFKGKLLSVYYPHKYLPIFTKKHLEHFVKSLGFTYQRKSVLDLQKVLMQYRTSHYGHISLLEFADLLYATYGAPVDYNGIVYTDEQLILAVGSTEVIPCANNKWPEDKVPVKVINKHSAYPRSAGKAKSALEKANYTCEYDSSHTTFKRYTDGRPYVEPHHLIPICEHMRFDKSLDHQANIVSLCSECHNRIHYGADRDVLIEKLYNKRISELQTAGIPVTLAVLKGWYNK